MFMTERGEIMRKTKPRSPRNTPNSGTHIQASYINTRFKSL